jgi:hypothetical protein
MTWLSMTENDEEDRYPAFVIRNLHSGIYQRHTPYQLV